MAEAQAVDRIYRIGQKREVFITRYIVPNSIETVKRLRGRICIESDALI
jgi:SNF2 family DNA or RNA helicase